MNFEQWQNVDTVLLDMDGTLLDLNYDNYVWNTLVPQAYAEQNNLAIDVAKEALFTHMMNIKGTIEFYSFEYWTHHCNFDEGKLVSIHQQAAGLIQYRQGVIEFLRKAKSLGKQLVITTNAHRASVDIKNQFTNLDKEVHEIVSSHDYGHPKEHFLFWQSLQQHCPYKPEQTLFLDDNEAVLDAAADANINYLLCISQPDSQRPIRKNLRYPYVNSLNEITHS